MDAQRSGLEKKLEDLLQQATAVAAELQGLDQGSGTPHYDQIELPAHALGQKFSRMIQSERAREVAAASLADAACPTCGRKCRVETKKRQVHSMDGPLELLETVARCRRCRRSFFPSAHRLGAGREGIDARIQAAPDHPERGDALSEADVPDHEADAPVPRFAKHD